MLVFSTHQGEKSTAKRSASGSKILAYLYEVIDVADHRIKVQMNSDSGEEAGLPYEIGEAASQGDFERVKAWLAGGSASDPRSIHSSGEYNWTLLHWTVARAQSPE